MDHDTSSSDRILRLRVELSEVTPPIWREIEVPADYDFWSLHVAIQDAMGWSDSHLHEFVLDPRSGETDSLVIGIPDRDAPDAGPRPGWDYPIGPFLHQGAPAIDYLYDFGAGWRHRIWCVAERTLREPEQRSALPRCLGGERACPPEDCGGPPAYAQLVTLASLDRDQVPEPGRDLYEWMPVGFDPESFDPEQVVFDDPQQRLALLPDPEFPENGDRLVGFTAGRFGRHSLTEALIEETWIEINELARIRALERFDEVARTQPHLLAFFLDETELGDEARGIGHFLLVAVYRMFSKSCAGEIREIPRARIEEVRLVLESAEEGALSGDEEITLFGADGELSRQPVLNELLADLISGELPPGDGKELVPRQLAAPERDLLFARMRVVVEVLDSELGG